MYVDVLHFATFPSCVIQIDHRLLHGCHAEWAENLDKALHTEDKCMHIEI